jgi:glutamate racemase
LQDTCPGLVGQIEKGELDSATTREILEMALRPMLERGIDTVVLGCTHYPFVIPVINQIVGSNVRVLDPAPAVARQIVRLLDVKGMRCDSPAPGELRFFTSGQAKLFLQQLPVLLGESREVKPIVWLRKGIRYVEANNLPFVP